MGLSKLRSDPDAASAVGPAVGAVAAEPGIQHRAPAHGYDVTVAGLSAYYESQRALNGVDLRFAGSQVTALIGPSGCGKSTLVRCIIRMHEETPGARAAGSVRLAGHDVYAPGPRRHRRAAADRDGLPDTQSVSDNVDLRQRRRRPESQRHGTQGGWGARGAVAAIRGALDEVKDRLRAPGIGLSGGQQKRLCIARAIAVEPEVILMDEPYSALDPVATLKVEELIDEVKQRYTIVIVTHNMQQASRVSDFTAFMLNGELVEHGPMTEIFTGPQDERTELYVTAKFG